MGKHFSIVHLNMSPEDRALIEAAAQLKGMTPQAFIKTETHKVAVEILRDQRAFSLNPEKFEELRALLDNPPPPSPKLRQLMQDPAPWG
jgi:uncharacterized protein (DUF1778 family)